MRTRTVERTIKTNVVTFKVYDTVKDEMTTEKVNLPFETRNYTVKKLINEAEKISDNTVRYISVIDSDLKANKYKIEERLFIELCEKSGIVKDMGVIDNE